MPNPPPNPRRPQNDSRLLDPRRRRVRVADSTMTPTPLHNARPSIGRAERNAGATARATPTTHFPQSTPEPGSWEAHRGVGDPNQRFSLFRLCPCEICFGRGKFPDADPVRCQACRGEGRQLQLIATCGTPEAVGVAIVTLGREGEWSDCPVGLIDNEGEKGQRWLIRPWERSPRNVSDAARLLKSQRR